MGKNLTKDQTKEIKENATQLVDNHGKAVAHYLKRARQEKGYTQQELADCLGISRDSLIDYEKSGELKYPTRVFLSMCEILDCSPQYLMGIDKLHHRETTDIHAAIGYSEEAIEKMIYRHNSTNERDDPEPFGYASNDMQREVIRFLDYLTIHIDEELLTECIKNAAYRTLSEYRVEETEADIREEYCEADGEVETEELVKERNHIKYYKNATRNAEWDFANWFTSSLKEYIAMREDDVAQSIEEWQQRHEDEDWWKWEKLI